MKRRLIEISLVAGCLLLAGSESVSAQRRAYLNRPSDQTGSSILGRIGGTYTGDYGNPLSTSRQNSTGAGNYGLGGSNFLGAGWNMGALPNPALPQAFTYAAQGVRIPMTQSPWASALYSVQGSELGAASGLQYATSVDAPLTSRIPVGFPALSSPYFAPPPPINATQSFFGLTQDYEGPAEPPGEDVTWLRLLQRDNENELQLRKERALALFKRATQQPAAGQDELLSQAQRALQQAATADPADPLPCLLLVHIEMERKQFISAAVNLQDAVARNPEIFSKSQDLSQFFGDPAILLARAREMTRLGDNNPDPINYALQGYSLWLLNDRQRLAETLTGMQAEEISSKMTPKALAVQYALSAVAN